MRVFAVQSQNDKVCNFFGDGELIEKKIPDIEPFNKMKIYNPCIKLDSGKYVWGFQCWWGEIEEKEGFIKDREVVIVEPDNIQPLKCEVL